MFTFWSDLRDRLRVLNLIKIHIMMSEMMLNGLFMSHCMTKPMFLALHTVRLSLISACVSAKSVKRYLSTLYEKFKAFFNWIVKTLVRRCGHQG